MSSAPGSSLLVEEPLCHILSQKHRGQRCDLCFCSSDTLKKCTACGFLEYCNRQCQKRDWTFHKLECRCLKTVSPKIPMDSARLMLRLVISLNLNLPANSQWSRTFQDFKTHESDIRSDPARSELFAKMMFTLKEYAASHVTLPEAKDLFTIFCKMTINSFTICDGELQGLGTGIYLSGSKLDHSCVPNAVPTFHGTTLVVKATEDIQKPSPDKIFISYIDQLGTSQERQQQLQEQYYFTCTCDRCRDTDRDDKMRSVCCPEVNCKGYLCLNSSYDFSQSCSLCGKLSLTETGIKKAVERMEVCRTNVKRIEELRKTDDVQSRYDLCQETITDIQGVLHEMNVDYIRLLDQAMDAAIDSEHWDVALAHGLKTLTPYRYYYGKTSPNVGVQLYKVGKLQLYLGELDSALRTLQESESVLRVTHGTNHNLYTSVKQTIGQCAEELRVKLESSSSS